MHTEFEHNLWSYVYYMLALQKKKAQGYPNFTGVEHYVYDRFLNKSTEWFPIQNTRYISSFFLTQ